MIERAPPPRHGITRAAAERLARIEEVGGSIPSGPTRIAHTWRDRLLAGATVSKTEVGDEPA